LLILHPTIGEIFRQQVIAIPCEKSPSRWWWPPWHTILRKPPALLRPLGRPLRHSVREAWNDVADHITKDPQRWISALLGAAIAIVVVVSLRARAAGSISAKLVTPGSTRGCHRASPGSRRSGRNTSRRPMAMAAPSNAEIHRADSL